MLGEHVLDAGIGREAILQIKAHKAHKLADRNLQPLVTSKFRKSDMEFHICFEKWQGVGITADSGAEWEITMTSKAAEEYPERLSIWIWIGALVLLVVVIVLVGIPN